MQRPLRPILVLALSTTAEPLLITSAAGSVHPLRQINAPPARTIVPHCSAVEGAEPTLPNVVDGLIPTRFDDVPKLVDTALAGIGLAGTIIAMGSLQTVLGMKLFVPPMMASGIIFFSGPKPPDPKGFLSGTICSATLSAALLLTLGQVVGEVTADGLSVGLLLMWYKTAGTLFPPAAVLAGALTGAAAKSAVDVDNPIVAAAGFLFFPWLAGHAVLYASAFGLSFVRAQARLQLVQFELRSLSGLDDSALREVFDKFDTDKSGALDADELKVALRVALGDDLSIEDCRGLVRSADRDGNGVVDFEEFGFICRGQV